eukprot:12403982-Karenia_brevis.AAC.1
MFNFGAKSFYEVNVDNFDTGRGSTMLNFGANTNFGMHDDRQEFRHTHTQCERGMAKKHFDEGMATKHTSRLLRLLRGEQLQPRGEQLLRRVPRGEQRLRTGAP